ncbi:MAG: RodZ domain-containing protein [Gaiellaceae bacterium]
MFEIGASLREARIKRGLSPADVHKAIRIRDRYLQALEEERWELLPGDAYVKGFLRTYADFLGLDGNLCVDEYNSRFGEREEQPLAPQPLARAELGGRGVGLLRPLLAIGVLVAIVAAVAAWQLDRGSNNAAPPTTGSSTTGSTTTTKKHHAPPPVALPTKAVFIAARGPCWLEIRRSGAHGPLLYENVLPQSHTLQMDLTSGPLWVSVGNPPALDVRLGSRLARGLPTRPGGSVLLTRRGTKPA